MKIALPALLAIALANAAPARSAESYTGLGAKSLDADTIKKFAPPSLEPELSRKIQSFMDIRSPGMGIVSPDGKRLYFSWRITGTSQVWRLDRPLGFPIQLTGGEDNTSIAGTTPDGKFLIISRDRKGEENPGLYVMSTEGGPLAMIQHKEGAQTFHQFATDDSKTVYYKSNDIKPDSYAIYRYELESGDKTLVFQEPGLWDIQDHKADGRVLLQKATGSWASEYFEYNLKDKKLTPLFGQNESMDYEAAYAAQDDELLVLTNKFNDFKRLYRWKRATGEFKPITPPLKYDVSGFGIDHGKKRILYQVNENGYTRLFALDARTFKSITLPKFPGADHTVGGSTTRNGKYTTLGVETSRAPRMNYVYDWQTRKLTQWVLPSAPEVDTTLFAESKLETYPARDGTLIPMFVRRPQKVCDDKICPVIVHFHGGPEGQSVAGFNPFAEYFVESGYIFVEPNVRGSEGYGKTWVDADNGAKRLQVITDIEDCALFIRKNWGRDGKPPRIGVMGGSYGGYSALMAMTRFAGAYDAGISIVGISNLVTFLNNTAPYRRILRISEYGDPEKDKQALTELSPMTYLDKIRAPLLIIQGVNDPRVPAGEAVQIHQALTQKKIPAELILFADEGHGAQKRESRGLQWGHSFRFFEKYLKDPADRSVARD